MLVLLCPGPWSLVPDRTLESCGPAQHTDVLVGGMAFSSLQNSLYCKMANKSLLSFVTQLAKTMSSLGFCIFWKSVPLPPAAVQSLALNLVYQDFSGM